LGKYPSPQYKKPAVESMAMPRGVAPCTQRDESFSAAMVALRSPQHSGAGIRPVNLWHRACVSLHKAENE
jgi:hypothetical protein